MGLDKHGFSLGKIWIFVIVFVILVGLGIAFSYNFFFKTHFLSYPSSEVGLFSQAAVSGSFSTSAKEFSGASCDVFVSPPNKQIKYFTTVECKDLGKTAVTDDELLGFGNGMKGVYTLIVFSQETSEGKIFSFKIG